jgi:hypothetical protein
MPAISYIANGFAKVPTPRDRRYGFDEIRFYNPTNHDSKIDITLYYEDRAPAQYPEQRLKAHSNELLLVFPDQNPDFFPESGAWGMRITSDTVLIVDHIMAAGVEPPPYGEKGKTAVQMFFNAEKYIGGVADVLAVSRLAKVWYFGDGFWITQNPEKPSFPFNETEWYHVLNPGKHAAEISMRCFYSDGSYDEFQHVLEPERVKIIDNEGLVKPHNVFGLHFESSEPVVVQAERFIRGINSVEEWGMHIHNVRPGVPAPLEMNEETA